MKKRSDNNILIVALTLIMGVFISSCSKDEFHRERPYGQEGEIVESNRKPSEESRKVFLYYVAGFNSLSDYLTENLRALERGYLPGNGRNDDVILVFSKLTARTADYKRQTSPVIYRLYADNEGKPIKDTLKTFSKGTIAASAKTMNEVLNFVKDSYPAKSYGMLFASHATGWLPPGYYNRSHTEEEDVFGISSFRYPFEREEEEFENPTPLYYEPIEQDPSLPAVRSIGQETDRSTGATRYYEISIQNFAKAIPMKLDYIIFDVCLTGGVEMAYEIKDKVKYMVGSQTEVLADGMVYDKLAGHLFKAEGPDLKAVCQDYFDLYQNKANPIERSATISLVDCSKLEKLSEACSAVFEKYGSQIQAVDAEKVQGFFRFGKHWFYDLRDILVQSGVPSQDLARVDAALDECIEYEAHTEQFLEIPIRTSCGLSMYLPNRGSKELDEYYKQFEWNIFSGLVR